MYALLRQISFFAIAALLHVIVLIMLIISYEFNAPLTVFENTNQRDVISAVVLGDTPKSKILPENPPPQIVPKKIAEPAPAKPAIQKEVPQKKDVVALKPPVKKKIIKTSKAEDEIAKALLADIIKHKEKQKKLSAKAMKAQYEKNLKKQAEKTLRQQLLNEEIKLQGQLNRKSQGVVNKYSALIKQAISSHWIVPAGVNKRLHCKLNIRIAPGGMVLDVQVAQSSGDMALDHSARAAVFNASPLPVPSDPKLFDQFRTFNMDVSPKDILNPSV